MQNRNFRHLLEEQWANGKFVCVGLDSDASQIPTAHIPDSKHMCASEKMAAFNLIIVEATKDLACAYKPNSAFYEESASGISALKQTIADIQAIAPEVPVILDAKRGDIGNTNAGYVKSVFDYMNADAVTVHPYLGGEALEPFLKRVDKGVFVLCRTSNPGAGEFQDIKVSTGPILFNDDPAYRPLYQIVAQRVTNHWNQNGNCGLVVGATYPDELGEVRKLVGDMPILIPGIGAQGGDLQKSILAGKDSRGKGIIINSSRGIIFASKEEDFAEAARRETLKLHTAINQCLQQEVNS